MKRIFILLGLLLLVVASVYAESTHQFATKLWGDDAQSTSPVTPTNGANSVPITMYVDAAPSAWNSPAIEEKIATLLSRHQNLRITQLIRDPKAQPPDISFAEGLDTLMHRAEASGARYAVAVRVTSPQLTTKKSLHVPLLFHMYQVTGTIEGELRIIDLIRKKQIAAEPFSVSMKGPRAMQATMDDDINDPDLHVSAPDKLRFFDQLESKAAEQISNRIRKLARGG